MWVSKTNVTFWVTRRQSPKAFDPFEENIQALCAESKISRPLNKSDTYLECFGNPLLCS